MPTTLAEDAFALVLDPRTGRISLGWSLQDWSALEAAVLADLAERRAVSIDGGRVTASDASLPPREPYLASALARIAHRPRKPIAHWVTWLPYRTPDLDAALGDALVEKGLATRGERRVLGLFRRPAWRLDEAFRAAVLARVRSALLDPAATSSRDRTLAAIAAATGNVGEALSDAERRSRRRAIRDLIADEPVARAARDVIRSATSAAYVPVMVTQGY